MLKQNAKTDARKDGLTVHADKCAWCGESGNIVPSNVIPAMLGGSFAPSIACDRCSNFLADELENSVMENEYLKAAVSRLGLSEKAIPTLTGVDQGSVTPLPIEEFYEADSTEEYKQCGCTFTKQVFGQEIQTLDDTSTKRDVDPRLVFKVAYELLSVWGLTEDDWLKARLGRFVTVNEGIGFANELGAFVTGNTEKGFSQYRKAGDIPFKRHHYAVLRMSKDGNLYFELALFGVIRCLLLLGKPSVFHEHLVSFLERCLMFSIDDGRVRRGCFPNVSCKRMTLWSDAAVDWRYWQLAKDEKYEGML